MLKNSIGYVVKMDKCKIHQNPIYDPIVGCVQCEIDRLTKSISKWN